MRLEKVFGVIKEDLATYVSRQEMDDCFKRVFDQKRQLVIYGSSKQGKTTLLNAHIKSENRILVQCFPTTTISDIYKDILKKLKVTIQSNSSNESKDSAKTKFNFKVKIPVSAEAGMKIEKPTDEQEINSELQMDVDGAQDVAEMMKKYFPEKIIILENFHYLEERVQKLFAFDLRTFQDIDVRVILLGIWKDGNRLTHYNGDLQDRMVELPIEPWTEKHLHEIIKLGEKSLNIDMSDIKNDLIKESSGNVGMLQELCKECCHDAHITETGDLRKLTSDNLQNAIVKITNSSIVGFRAFETPTDAKPRQLKTDGGRNL